MKRRMMAVLLTLCMVLSLVPATAFAAGSDFTDTDGHWAESIIEKWADYGVVSGLGNNMFGPNNELSRAQLAQIMYNLLKLTASEKDPAFEDVADSAWYSAAVGACAREGIVSGIGSNKYGPSQVATREQCMVMLCNVFGIKPLENTSVLNQFKDKDSVSNWAKGFVAALVEKGLVSGTSTGISGNAPINRASVLALVNNMVSVYIAEPGEYDLKNEEVKGIVLVVCDDVEIVDAAEGTTIVTGPNADDITVNGEAIKADTTFIVKEEETAGGGGGGSRPSTPEEPDHECVFGEWKSNEDGTHTRECECNETETEDCSLGEVYTSNEAGKHTRECELCGYVEEESCEYNWDECVKCEYADGNFHISTVEELTSFAAIVLDGEEFTGKTIVLEEDIDLTDVEWTPIGDGANKFNGTFDGQGNTISNLSCAGTEFVGLFGRGWTDSVIKNVNLEDVTLSGNHYVAAVIAHTYGDVIDCSVDGFEIVVTTNNVAAEGEEPEYDNGDKVGGIAGWASCGKITGCSVSNGTIAAYRDAGGILGASINDGSYTDVTECSVSDVTITIDQTENSYGFKAPNAGAFVGRSDGDAEIADNTEDNVTITIKLARLPGGEGEEPKDVVATIGNAAYTEFDAALNAAQDGDKIVVVEGSHKLTGDATGKSLTIVGGNNGIVIDCTEAIGLHGSTIAFENLTIQGENVNYEGLQNTSKVTYTDCTIKSRLTLYADTVEFTDCIFEGTGDYLWTYDADDVTFTNCEFNNANSKAILVYQESNSEVCNVTLTDCTFNAEEKGYTGSGDWTAAVEIDSSLAPANVVIQNCDADENYSDIVRHKSGNNAIICVDGIFLANSAEMLQKTIDSAENAITIQMLDGDYATTQIQVGADKDITIIGSEADKVSFEGQFKVVGNLTLKNMTVNTPTAAVTGEVSQFSKSAIAVTNDGEVVCKDVTFNMADGISDATAITAWWSTGDGANIDVKNCVFYCGGQRPIRSDACVTVEECEFYNQYRYAVQMTSKSSTMDEEAEAYVIFKNNKIFAGETAVGKPVYGVQLEGGYGCSELTITGEGNTIDYGETGKIGTMYFCECGKVDHATITWNVEEAPKHESEIVPGFFEIEENKTYEITSKEGLEYFAKTVNGDSEAELDAKNYSGMTVKLMTDIDLNNEEWTPIGIDAPQDETDKPFSGTFDGTGKTISNLMITGDNSNVGLFGFTTNGEIKNVSIENANISGYLNVAVVAGNPYTSKYTNIEVSGHVEVNGYAYVGTVGGKNVYANWTDITVDVDESSYVKAESENYRTYVGGVIGFMGEGGHEVKNVTSNIDVIGSTCDVGGIVGIAHYGNRFTNCSSSGDVKITNQGDPGDTLEIGGIAGVWNNGGADVTFTNCSHTGKLTTPDVTVYPYGGLIGRAYSTTGSGKLIIDGAEMIIDGFGINEEENAYLVSNAAGLAMLEDYFGVAGSGDQTLTIMADIDMTEVEWTPIKVDGYHGADVMTVEGNGNTITGLTAPLFAGGFAGGSGIVINDLTIADSEIVSTNTVGSGAFIESVDSMDTITLENCHLLNSTLTGGSGSRTGGLIGWTAGYNNVNDGPVKTYVTITDCSVIGNEITCDGSVGGLYGHAGNNAWTFSTVEDCIVKDNVLTSTDDGGWRVGVVVGTANVGELTIKNITESGNTLSQTGKTAPEGQSNLYGRFVPGTTGKLIIDGTEIVNE